MMSCLGLRIFEYSKYPEGWSSDEGRDPQLEFRISIMHAVKDDSGSFTCVTPARHTHTVEVVVKVWCSCSRTYPSVTHSFSPPGG